MTDKQPPKKKARGIGPINPYGTFGSPNDQESERVETQHAERPAVQTASSPDAQRASSSNVKTSKHPDWKQQTFYLPPALRQWLRHRAVASDLEISEIIVLALKEYQERHS